MPEKDLSPLLYLDLATRIDSSRRAVSCCGRHRNSRATLHANQINGEINGEINGVARVSRESENLARVRTRLARMNEQKRRKGNGIDCIIVERIGRAVPGPKSTRNRPRDPQGGIIGTKRKIGYQITLAHRECIRHVGDQRIRMRCRKKFF